MRQAGVLCAAALFALDHNLERLAEDHRLARRLAAGLARIEGVRCDISGVETNIVNFDVPGDAARFAAQAASRGVRLHAVAKHRLRAVTHRELSERDIERAVSVLVEVGQPDPLDR